MRGRNTTPCLIRHIVQNKRFMSSLDDIPNPELSEHTKQMAEEQHKLQGNIFLKLSENTKTGFQDQLIDNKGVTLIWRVRQSKSQNHQALQQKDQLIYSLKELITRNHINNDYAGVDTFQKTYWQRRLNLRRRRIKWRQHL